VEDFAVKRIGIGLAAVLIALPALRAGDAKDKPKPDQPGTPAEQYRAVVKEYDQAVEDFQKAMTGAKTDEERQKAFQKMPQTNKYANRLLELAEKHPADPAAVDALAWVLSHDFGPTSDKASELLLKQPVLDKRVAGVVMYLQYGFTPAKAKLARAMVKSPDRTVRGRACYVVAVALREKDGKEADKFRDLVLKEYADVTNEGGATLADAVNAPQFEKDRLVIGKAVPEIEGQDIDGRRFKLSDYRGKVVLLDFWGNW
jgi:hypothetical protein